MTASREIETLGLQLGLNFDPTILKFAGIDAESLEIDHTHIGAAAAKNGDLTLSWDNVHGQTLRSGEQLFTVSFKAQRAGSLSDVLSLNTQDLSSEIYSTSLETMDLRLTYGTDISKGISLYQNTPNPFADHTTVSFYLPAPTEVTLQISDVTGKVIKNYTGSFDEGNNYISVSKDELTVGGVLYYTLSTDQFTDTKRMIVLK